jgi:hypothetical protein
VNFRGSFERFYFECKLGRSTVDLHPINPLVTPQVIAGNTRSNLWKAWLFAVLWNLVSAPLFVLVPREIERNPMAAVAVIFPLVGFGSLVWAVMTTLRWRRFGLSRFEMSPAALGGRCSGTIHTRLALDDVRSIWPRRPRRSPKISSHEGHDDHDREGFLVGRECRAAIPRD